MPPPTSSPSRRPTSDGMASKAFAAGYKDRGLMEKDKDLDALRSGDNFRELVESLPEALAGDLTPGTE